MPEWGTELTAMGLLAFAVYQMFTAIKPTLEANTTAIVELKTLVKTLVESLPKGGGQA